MYQERKNLIGIVLKNCHYKKKKSFKKNNNNKITFILLMNDSLKIIKYENNFNRERK